MLIPIIFDVSHSRGRFRYYVDILNIPNLRFLINTDVDIFDNNIYWSDTPHKIEIFVSTGSHGSSSLSSGIIMTYTGGLNTRLEVIFVELLF